MAFCLFLPVTLTAQLMDLAVVHQVQDEEINQILFTLDDAELVMSEAFQGRKADLNESHPQLTVSGDFTGDGQDEIALFEDLLYTPNMNPDFTCSVVSVRRSAGKQFVPAGSWFSHIDSSLSFNHVDFAVAADYNLDGFCDIALFYNDHNSELLSIYVLKSDGTGFSVPDQWYSCARTDFNFTALKFACQGDFNGNGKPDIAVFYNYFGTAPETKQSVFIFETEGNSFTLLPVAYDASKASYDFSAMKFALPGDYNLDGYTDVAVLLEDPISLDLLLPVFEGTATGQLIPFDYNSFVDSEPYIANILHAAGGDFAGDSARDLALFYDNPGTGKQEILVLESDLNAFKAPASYFSTDTETLSMSDIASVQSGKFDCQPVVRAVTWKDDRKGAISFTFDDGYRGAFEHGGAELEAAGLKGTFYIFTDTSVIYDGELASTSLMRSYKTMGHEIASHTANHANLGFITASGDVDSLEMLLSGSLEELNVRFDQYTTSMSIPFGSFRHGTLDHISQHFYSARSSQFGFNLATPYDFYALKSWPILSTTSPAYVDNLLAIAESYGTYLPLMYHDMLDEPFDEDVLIYTYSRDLFKETVQDAMSRDLWIDTHQRIYKYIMERNALKILMPDSYDVGAQTGHFTFEADDGLVDSIFNVELTLRISLPVSWSEDSVSVGTEGELQNIKTEQDSLGYYIHYNYLPQAGVSIHIYDGPDIGTGRRDDFELPSGLQLVAAPNPFVHETLISVSEDVSEDGFLIVRDIQGRIVREIRDHLERTFSLKRENLSRGIYIVQLIQAGKAPVSIKLMIL